MADSPVSYIVLHPDLCRSFLAVPPSSQVLRRINVDLVSKRDAVMPIRSHIYVPLHHTLYLV